LSKWFQSVSSRLVEGAQSASLAVRHPGTVCPEMWKLDA